MAKDSSKKTAVTDPLEAAKIQAKPPALTPPPPPPPPMLAVPTGEIEPPKPPVKKFRVAETTTISLFGQMTKLNKDDIISDASHGPDAMRRIIQCNVALVEHKE